MPNAPTPLLHTDESTIGNGSYKAGGRKWQQWNGLVHSPWSLKRELSTRTWGGGTGDGGVVHPSQGVGHQRA